MAEVLGLFVHPSYFAWIASAIEGYKVEPYCKQIRCVGAWREIPSSLFWGDRDEYGASLILYREDTPLQILVIHYRFSEGVLTEPSDVVARQRFAKKEREWISELIKIVCEQRADDWSVETGYRNLLPLLDRQDERVYPQLSGKEIAVVRLPRPIDEYVSSLDKAPSGGRQILEAEDSIGRALLNATDRMQETRERMLDKLSASRLPSASDIEEFDDVALQLAKRLKAEIAWDVKTPQTYLPSWLDEFEDIIDPETKEMLKTAAIIAPNAKRFAQSSFDFTVAGCCLWKAVERELNLSLIWHLRRRRGIVDVSPFELSDLTAESVMIAGVELGPGRKGYELRGIELGKIERLLRGNPKHNGLQSELTGIKHPEELARKMTSRDLTNGLEKVRLLRNRYSHLSSMNFEKYQELRSYVLPEIDFSLLREVLNIKRPIKKYWDRLDKPHGVDQRNHGAS